MEKKSLTSLDSQSLQALIEKVAEEVNNSKLSNISLMLNNSLQYSAEQNNVTTSLVLAGEVSNIHSAKVKSLEEKVKKVLEEFESKALSYKVSTTYSVGEKFPKVEKLLTVPSKEEKDFETPSGEVCLIDFWATWCGPCQKPMAHNQEILVKNETVWAGKARIIGISLDDEYDSLEERINSKGWNKIEHYQAAGGWESSAAGQFGITGIPCVMIVDKNGYIRFRGHPSEVNIEDKINELINEADGAFVPENSKKDEAENAEGSNEESEKKEPKLTLEEEIKVIKEFSEGYATIKDLLVGEPRYWLGIQSRRTILPKPNHRIQAYLEASTKAENKQNFIEIHKKLFKNLHSAVPKEINVTIPKTFKIAFGKSCATCKKELSKAVPHYVCSECQNEGVEDHAFCTDCADKELSQEIESSSQLFHPHGLALVHEKCESGIDCVKRQFVSKLVADDDESIKERKESKTVWGFYCDGCGGPMKVYRWGCAQCRDFDFCPTCFEAGKNPNHENHKTLMEKVVASGHDETHFFYRNHYLQTLRPCPPDTINFEVQED